MKIMVSTTTVCEIYQFPKNKKKKRCLSLPDSYMDCLLWCLATLSELVARVVALERRKIL